ncbi:hypothetical protein [Saccharicrinis sp. FJH54]|uniref:hypothetical protein n=1 Tax=Saccharicrinis sp. FJH54 TaxID=3344665 RepID=UPI0035D4E0E1
MKDPYFRKEILIDLIKDQAPERTDLIEQLTQLEVVGWIRRPYISLYKPSSSDRNRSKLEYCDCLELEHEIEGDIILDLSKEGIIIGIELINQIHD